MADVFISYKREERSECERIAAKLRALELDVWFDARLTAGDSFTAEIEREVRLARCVLVLWSPGSVASRWVRNEADIGRERGVLAAAQLKPCDMPIEFRDIHFDAVHDPEFSDEDEGWLKLLGRIGQLAQRQSLADYSRAIGMAGRPLRQWAEANPLDPLAAKARLLADQVGHPGLVATIRPPAPKSRFPFVSVLLSVLIAGGVGVLGGWRFLPAFLDEKTLTSPASVQTGSMQTMTRKAESSEPKDLQLASLELVGRWNFSGGPSGCSAEEVVVVALGRGSLLVGRRNTGTGSGFRRRLDRSEGSGRRDLWLSSRRRCRAACAQRTPLER